MQMADDSGDRREPPPPPEPTAAAIMHTIVENQRMMAENQRVMADVMRQMARDDRHRRNDAEAYQESNFKRFMDTKPPIFREVEEPLHADEWLNTIEQKFRLVNLSDEQKVEFASH